jgi:prophage maintenance system killer protein
MRRQCSFAALPRGHPFNDGNKRTGFLVAAYYLRIMDYQPPATYRVGEVVDFCVRVSAGEIRDIQEIAEEIGHLWSL